MYNQEKSYKSYTILLSDVLIWRDLWTLVIVVVVAFSLIVDSVYIYKTDCISISLFTFWLFAINWDKFVAFKLLYP